MSLCVFQGTFNPIHKVHLKIAEFAKKYYKFDNILFIPAYIPPHKSIDKTLARHRFNMVKLAISSFRGFNISDIEYKRDQNSYTYNTIVELKKKYNLTNERINYLIGTDAFMNIQSWYKSDKLKELLHFIVFKRADDIDMPSFDILKDYDFEIAPMNYIDVSSTRLRNYLRKGLSIKDMELPVVREYISKNGLYTEK